jgi:hypothetical protein
MTAVLVRDGISAGLPVVEERNTIVWDYVARAGLERLVEWIDAKTPPASIPPITLVDGAIARDEIGNALGGVRLPDVVAPLAVHAGMKSELTAVALMGESIPLSAERIGEIYPDEATFQKTWDGAVDDLADLGLVLPEAIRTVKERGRTLYRSAIGNAR